MSRKILLVDDDSIFTDLVINSSDLYSDTYVVEIARNGIEALSKMKNNDYSIVFTDLQMPRMDGFTLFEHIKKNFPDIPVIIVTGTGKTKTESVLMKKGAVGYLQKPVNLKAMIKMIMTLLKKETEGGRLHDASLEMFTQLIEMEQKTCTIRIDNKLTLQRGVLFFRNGELVNARIGITSGLDIAYEIFSWDNISLSIENSCRSTLLKIDQDLQSILVEAMRLKDEKKATGNEPTMPPPPKKPEPAPRPTASKPVQKAAPQKPVSTSEKPPETTLVDQVKNKLETSLGEKSKSFDIYTDEGWESFLRHCDLVGRFFKTGNLKSCYVDNGNQSDYIIIPDKKPVIIETKAKSSYETILQIVSD